MEDLYSEMKYQEICQQFHSFAGDNQVIGLAFAFPFEAKGYLDSIMSFINIPNIMDPMTKKERAILNNLKKVRLTHKTHIS